MPIHQYTHLTRITALTPLLCFLIWANTSSKAYPFSHQRASLVIDQQGPLDGGDSHKSLTPPPPLKHEGPLSCNGTLTTNSNAKNSSLVCNGNTLCEGVTLCNDTLICSGDWVIGSGSLLCTGELSCNGALTCVTALPASCLPGLGRVPTWCLGVLLGFLILVSGLIRGCAAAFISLDNTELAIYTMEETKTKKELSERILELKNYHTTWVMSCLLMCSVTINLSLPLISACLLDNHLWGLLLSAGLLIVVGEILPGIIFPRFPVALLGNMLWFIYIILTLFSLPAGLVVLILHYAVELGPGKKRIIYDTKQLAALVDFHSGHQERGGKLSMDTVRVTKGALYLEDKVAGDIMKPISEVKMLNMNARMDIGRWGSVMSWGYSRIPIYTLMEDYQGADPPYQDWPIKIWGFLYSFDMMSLVLEEVTTLKTVPFHHLPVITEDYPLWELLHTFQDGHSHMAIVEKGPNEIESKIPNTPEDVLPGFRIWTVMIDILRDKLKLVGKKKSHKPPMLRTPKYWTNSLEYKTSAEEPLGIVTLEDVLEALLQSSILDEKDISHFRRRVHGASDSMRIVTSAGLGPPFLSQELATAEGGEGGPPRGAPAKSSPMARYTESRLATDGKRASGKHFLSFSKPLAPVSVRNRVGNVLVGSSAGRGIRKAIAKRTPNTDGAASETRGDASESGYSRGRNEIELENQTASISSPPLSAPSTISRYPDLWALSSEFEDSSDVTLETLDEEGRISNE